MTAEPSAFDRVLGYGGPRDTPNVLGTELPTPCPMCHRLADVVDELRRSNEWLASELAKVNQTLAAISNREASRADTD